MKFNKQNKGIISLAIVFSIGFLALSIAMATSVSALQELKKSYNAVSGDKSFLAAESAVREGTYQYINDVLLSYTGGTPQLINDSSDGSIIVTDIGWPYIEIEGEAENRTTQRQVVYTLTTFPEGMAFNHAVYSQNNLDFGGNASINGSIFAENNISFTGASATINGDAYSPNPITDTDNINGEVFEEVTSILPPQVDLLPYRAEAIINSTYFIDTEDTENYLNNETKTAVVYVESTEKTKIQGSNTDLTGSLVTEGDLNITGGTFTASDNHLAILVQGDLRMAGGVTVNGIVYVLGATSFGGGTNTINGSLISVGGTNITDVTGNTTINFDPALLVDWPDIQGLDTISAGPPQITNWTQQ